MRSWKTTTLGIIAALIALGQCAIAQFDNDPNTVPNWESAIALAAVAAGLVAARDNDKSSEDVKIKN